MIDEYVNINQFNSENTINIYPNPVSKMININITNWDSNVINWEIINITGQIILEGIIYPENSESFKELDLDFMKPGIYYFRFTTDNKTITKKISKQ